MSELNNVNSQGKQSALPKAIVSANAPTLLMVTETYYRNARGRLVVKSPYRDAAFYEMTRTANLEDFMVEPRQV